MLPTSYARPGLDPLLEDLQEQRQYKDYHQQHLQEKLNQVIDREVLQQSPHYLVHEHRHRYLKPESLVFPYHIMKRQRGYQTQHYAYLHVRLRLRTRQRNVEVNQQKQLVNRRIIILLLQQGNVSQIGQATRHPEYSKSHSHYLLLYYTECFQSNCANQQKENHFILLLHQIYINNYYMILFLLLNLAYTQSLQCTCQHYNTKDLCIQNGCLWDQTCTDYQCLNYENQEDCLSTIYTNQRNLFCYWDSQSEQKCLAYSQCSDLVFLEPTNESICQQFGCSFMQEVPNSCRDFDCGTIYIESECNTKTHLSKSSMGTCYWKDYCRTFTSNTPCADRVSEEKCLQKEDCYWKRYSEGKFSCSDSGCSSASSDQECQSIRPFNGVCLWSTYKKECIRLTVNSDCEEFSYQKACEEFRANCIWNKMTSRCVAVACKDVACSSDVAAFRSSNMGEFLFCKKTDGECVEAEEGKIGEKKCNAQTENYYVWDSEGGLCKKCYSALLSLGYVLLLINQIM